MSTTSTSLACRMLAAAGSAYYIDGTGNFTPPTTDPIYNAVGWTVPPTPIVGSGVKDEDIDACLIGTTGDGTVVSFRGTLVLSTPPTAPEIVDWIQDFLLIKPYTDSTVATWGPQVKVHPGWWDSVVNIQSQLLAALAQVPAGTNLYFTGHSKGGAMATLAAMLWSVLNPKSPQPVVYSYASPRPGNTALATAFVGQNLTQNRYENYLDIAPLFPPSDSDVNNVLIPAVGDAHFFGKIDTIWYTIVTGLLNGVAGWDYASVGNGQYINSQGTLVPANSNSQWLDIFSALADGSTFDDIAAAHCHGCPVTGCQGGYMMAVCPGFCPSTGSVTT